MSDWQRIDAAGADSMERELRREMCAGHPLHHRVVRAVARDDDDVAFEVDGSELWIVHLTWRQESDPRWPHAVRVEALPETDLDHRAPAPRRGSNGR